MSLIEAEGLHSAAGEVFVLAELGDFGVGPPKRLAIDLRLPAADVAEARKSAFGAPFELRLRPGKTRVAVGVWDAVSGTGSYVGKTFEIQSDSP